MGQVATKIAREAAIRTHITGRSELIGPEDLMSFLEARERADGLIVGIEGFRFVGSGVEPEMRWIAKDMRCNEIVIDIGEPPGMPPSRFYDMEAKATAGYPRYREDPQP